jgi:hypothetical protein
MSASSLVHNTLFALLPVVQIYGGVLKDPSKIIIYTPILYGKFRPKSGWLKKKYTQRIEVVSSKFNLGPLSSKIT